MNFPFLLLCTLLCSLTSFAQDLRFRTYGKATVKGYQFPYRSGGGSVETCVSAKNSTEIKDNCAPDFFTVGQLNDRKIGPYANLTDGRIFRRWGFLRDTRPQRWDCSTGLDFSTTNWISTSRCYDQIGTDKYEELLRNEGVFSFPLLPDLGVPRGQEYKRDVLKLMHDSEKDLIRKVIENYLSIGTSDTIVFEIGNEPNIYPAMAPETYGWYLEMYADTIKKAAAAVRSQQKRVVNVKIMAAGLWISDGMPSALVEALNQGLHISFGVLSIAVPVGIDICKWLGIPYPCGVLWRGIQLNEGMDIKSQFYTDVRSYWDKTLAASGKGTIDIANLHFYPYIATGATLSMQQQLVNLKTLAAHAADGATTHDVWLTEIGNFNPYTDINATAKVMKPMLTALKANFVPYAKRWYWFKNAGDDKKFKSLPGQWVYDLAGGWAVLIEIIESVASPASILGEAVTVKKPKLGPQAVKELLRFLGRIKGNNPAQGLYESESAMAAGNPRQLGIVYRSFALNSTHIARRLRGRYEGVSERDYIDE